MSGDVYLKQAWARVKVLTDDGRTRIKDFVQGDLIPVEELAEGELGRLLSLGVVGGKAAVAVVSAADPADAPAVEAAVTATDSAIANLETLDVEGIAAVIKAGHGPVGALVKAVGDDASLAKKVLEAETAATGGDPRVSLVRALEKVISNDAG